MYFIFIWTITYGKKQIYIATPMHTLLYVHTHVL